MIYSMFAWMAGDMSFGDRASTAGIVTLQGMLTVFAVLAVLWGAIALMHRLLIGKSEEKTPSDKKSESAEAVASPVAVSADDAALAAAIAAALAATEDEGALVAAITAAISAKLADEGYTGTFRVVSFKRAGNASRRRK